MTTRRFDIVIVACMVMILVCACAAILFVLLPKRKEMPEHLPTPEPLAFIAITGFSKPCEPEACHHTFGDPVPVPGTLCHCGRTYYRQDGYAIMREVIVNG